MTVKEFALQVFRRGVTISTVLGIGYLVFHLGWKGVIGMLIGFTLMAVIIMSKNPVFMYFVDKANAGYYVDEIKGDKYERKQTDVHVVEGEVQEKSSDNVGEESSDKLS